MIIVIPIEIKVRELLNKIFLSYQILKKIKSSKIILCGSRFLFQRIGAYKNCIFFEKNIFYKRFFHSSKNNKILMIDEEGPVSLFEEYTSFFRYHKKNFDNFDKFYLWGQNDIKKLDPIYKRNKNKILISGHPKFDLLKKPYLGIFDKEVSVIKKKYKKYILFASSFEDNRNLAINQAIIGIKEACSDKSIEYLKKQIFNYKKIIDCHSKNYFSAINLLKKIAVANPEINVVFRKHPHEDHKEVIKKFGDLPRNLYIDYRFTITPWIIGSHIYVHSGCTTFFEAAKLNKNIITYIPKVFGKKLEFFKNTTNYFSNEIECFNQINKFLILSKNFKQKRNLNKISKTIENISSKDFYKMLILDIQKIKLEGKSEYIFTEKNQTIFSLFYYRIKTALFYILSIIKNNIILKTPLIYLLKESHIYSSKAIKNKFEGIKKVELQRVFDQLSILETDKKSKIIVKKICENVFICSKGT
jgi:surface carbohydrate biosynthesis protein